MLRNDPSDYVNRSVPDCSNGPAISRLLGSSPMKQRKSLRRLFVSCLTAGMAIGTANAGDGFIRQPSMKKTPKVVVQPKVAQPSTTQTQPTVESAPKADASETRVVAQPIKHSKVVAQVAENSRDTSNAATGVARGEEAPPPPQTITEVSQISPSVADTPKPVWKEPSPREALPTQQRATRSQRVESETLDWTGISLSTPTVTAEQKKLNSSGGSNALQWVTRGQEQIQSDFAAPTFSSESLEAESSNDFYSSIPMVKSSPSHTSVSHPQMPSQAVKKEDETKKLASMVSHRILSSAPRVAQQNVEKQTVKPIDSLPGWQSIGEKLGLRLASCETLLQRRAFLSAREEAEQAGMFLVHFLDGLQNRYHCEPAWAAALRALDESEDFQADVRMTTDGTLLQRIIESHETPVLKNADATQLAPLTAAQHYRLYAQASLEVATQNHPWASEILYAIGRTYQAQADAGDGKRELHRLRAITFYRAAVKANPSNSLALNQLGFLLLQLDRARDAQAALIASVNTEVSRPALQNLIEASRRLGDQQTRNWAHQTLATLGAPPQAQPTPAVVEVNPRAFAAMSPIGSGPKPAVQTASGFNTNPVSR